MQRQNRGIDPALELLCPFLRLRTSSDLFSPAQGDMSVRHGAVYRISVYNKRHETILPAKSEKEPV